MPEIRPAESHDAGSENRSGAYFGVPASGLPLKGGAKRYVSTGSGANRHLQPGWADFLMVRGRNPNTDNPSSSHADGSAGTCGRCCADHARSAEKAFALGSGLFPFTSLVS